MSRTPVIDHRRYNAALALLGLTHEDVAREAKVSSRHIWFCIRGDRRLTEPLAAIMKRVLGEDGWAFATGKSEFLRAQCPGKSN